MLNDSIEKILAVALPAGELLSETAKELIVQAAVAGIRMRAPDSLIESKIQRIVQAYAPALSQVFAEAIGTAWISAVRDVVKLLPDATLKEMSWPISREERPTVTQLKKRFPQIKREVNELARKGIVTTQELVALSDGAEAQALGFIQRDVAEQIGDVKYITAGRMTERVSRAKLVEDLSKVFSTGKMGPAHVGEQLEQAIREAASLGRRQIEANPLVYLALPYKLYVATHDRVLRRTHGALERLGLNGTAVYRSDDPFWDYFDPPWEWNCRCGAVLLTIEQAAARGVREAMEWLRTGLAPTTPEWRLDAIPFRPNARFYKT